MSNLFYLGLGIRFPVSSAQFNYTDHGLTARVHVDMLHRDFLLPLPTMPIQCIEQGHIRARKLVGLAQILASALECLLATHSAPVTLHSGIVSRHNLSS